MTNQEKKSLILKLIITLSRAIKKKCFYLTVLEVGCDLTTLSRAEKRVLVQKALAPLFFQAAQ